MKKLYKISLLLSVMQFISISILAILTTNVDAKVSDSALVVAASDGEVETVRSLLEKGVDIDAKDDKGMTALMGAGKWGRKKRQK